MTDTSADGGGIRGLSELVVLEEIMNRIKHDLNADEDLLPADFFDLIGGTSTGGYDRDRNSFVYAAANSS